MSKKVLKLVLFLTGMVIVVLGINVGFGGITTLGLQGGTDFYTVTDHDTFGIRDNHVRFAGGIILAIGITITGCAIYLENAFTPMMIITTAFVIGGLARLSALDTGILFSSDILPSLIIELFGFPLLAYWVWRESKKPQSM
ncbi:MAG: DUF4345 family protein [Pseudomonadota bacterium]